MKQNIGMSTTPINNIEILILAAGQSSRFGSPKQLAFLGKNTLLQIVIKKAWGIAIPSYKRSVSVVLGAHSEQIKSHLRSCDYFDNINILDNNQWQTGLSSSIQRGIQQSNADAVLILLADQPFIHTYELEKLIRVGLNHPSQAAAATYSDKNSHSVSLGVPAFLGKTILFSVAEFDWRSWCLLFAQSNSPYSSCKY